MQRTTTSGSRVEDRLVGLPARRGRSARACRPGGRNTGSSGSIRGPPGGSAAAATSRSVRSRSRPAQAPGPQRLRQQPQAHDVAQVADGAVDAALVGEVRAPALLGQHRRVELDADQPPGAAGDVAEPGRVGGDADDGRGGVVRADGGHEAARARCRAPPGRPRTPRRAPGPAGTTSGSRPGGSPRAWTSSTGPVARARVHQPRGRGVGLLRRPDAGQPVAEQVRDRAAPGRRRHGPARRGPGRPRAGRAC